MSGVFLYFFRSVLVRNQLFRLRIAVNAICFSSLVNKPLVVLAMVYCPQQPCFQRFQSIMPWINHVSNQIYLRIDGILRASFRYGKCQLVMTLIIPDIIKLHPIKWIINFVLRHLDPLPPWLTRKKHPSKERRLYVYSGIKFYWYFVESRSKGPEERRNQWPFNSPWRISKCWRWNFSLG